MKSLFLAIAAAATFVGSIRVAMALTPQPSEVCYDALGNTRYVPVGQPCKANEQKTKVLPQTSNPADDPQAALQKQVTDLTAKVSALQAQVNQIQEKQNVSQSGYVSHPGNSTAYNPKDVSRPGHVADPNWTGGFSHDGIAHNMVRAPFVVVDRNGKAILDVTEDGPSGRGVYVVDAAGLTRIAMQIAPSGPGVTLFGNNDQSSVQLASKYDNGTAQFYNSLSQSVVLIGSATDSSTGTIQVGDASGTELVNVSADGRHGEILLRGPGKSVKVWEFSLLPHL